MHIKINITEMEPNFLLHMLWPKTIIRNQTNTPGDIMDLDLYI
jgi:hypothetical protein